MNGELRTATGRSDLVRLALRLTVEEALEGEVADALGRERYAPGDGERAGYRNRGAGGAFGPHPGARGSGGRALRARAIDARHRGRLHRRAGPKAFVARGGERDHRAAVGGDEAFSKHDLPERPIACLYVDGIAERLRPGQKREAVPAVWGHQGRWAQGPAGVMAGSKEDARPGRSLARRLRRRGADHSGDRGVLSPLGAPALPGPPPAQPRHQSLGQSVAGVQGPRHRLLTDAVANDRPRSGERHPRRLRRCRAERARLL